MQEKESEDESTQHFDSAQPTIGVVQLSAGIETEHNEETAHINDLFA